MGVCFSPAGAVIGTVQIFATAGAVMHPDWVPQRWQILLGFQAANILVVIFITCASKGLALLNRIAGKLSRAVCNNVQRLIMNRDHRFRQLVRRHGFSPRTWRRSFLKPVSSDSIFPLHMLGTMLRYGIALFGLRSRTRPAFPLNLTLFSSGFASHSTLTVLRTGCAVCQMMLTTLVALFPSLSVLNSWVISSRASLLASPLVGVPYAYISV